MIEDVGTRREKNRWDYTNRRRCKLPPRVRSVTLNDDNERKSPEELLTMVMTPGGTNRRGLARDEDAPSPQPRWQGGGGSRQQNGAGNGTRGSVAVAPART